MLGNVFLEPCRMEMVFTLVRQKVMFRGMSYGKVLLIEKYEEKTCAIVFLVCHGLRVMRILAVV